MSGLAHVGPVGRLDVAVFRIVERLAVTQMPREWPAFRPYVERWAHQQFGRQRPIGRAAAVLAKAVQEARGCA